MADKKSSARIQELEEQLAEAQETLRAIRQGEVDAVVVDGGPKGDQVFTLQGSDRPYRLLVEAMSEGALTLMPEGTVLYANRQVAQMVRRPLEQVIGCPWQRLFPVNEHPKFEDLLVQARSRASKTESCLRDSAGGLLAVHVSVSLADLDGVQVFTVLLTDISQRKAAEEELRKTNAALAERTAKLDEMVSELEHFSYTITHDMRAPLRAMQGFGQILMDECAECLNEERQTYIKRITESASRMDNLITDALNYSKIVQQELRLQPVNADELLRGIIEIYPQFQPPQAQITMDGPIPPVLGNEAALTQCFSNLLGNAIKFVHPGTTPQVRIWSSPAEDPDLVRIWFQDNGIGIAKEHQKQIFKMFLRLSTHYEGTGIGLALVRKVMERMKGKVGVDSELGKGSRFWIELHRVEPKD